MTRNEALAWAIYTWQREVATPSADAAERATARVLLGAIDIRLHPDEATRCARFARTRYESVAGHTVDELLDLRERGYSIDADQIAAARRRERAASPS